MKTLRLDERVSFETLLELEEAAFQEVCSGREGTLIFAEVEPTITLGRRAVEAKDLRLTREALEARGVQVVRVPRGGLATYHGPGQWVIFPCESLERLMGDQRAVSKVVRALLEISSTVFRLLGVEDVEIRTGCELGVWSRNTKLAQVGVRVDSGVLRHGVSLNIYPTETSFQGLVPCGLSQVKVSSVSEVLGLESEREARGLFARVPDLWTETAAKLGWPIDARLVSVVDQRPVPNLS